MTFRNIILHACLLLVFVCFRQAQCQYLDVYSGASFSSLWYGKAPSLAGVTLLETDNYGVSFGMSLNLPIRNKYGLSLDISRILKGSSFETMIGPPASTYEYSSSVFDVSLQYFMLSLLTYCDFQKWKPFLPKLSLGLGTGYLYSARLSGDSSVTNQCNRWDFQFVGSLEYNVLKEFALGISYSVGFLEITDKLRQLPGYRNESTSFYAKYRYSLCHKNGAKSVSIGNSSDNSSLFNNIELLISTGIASPFGEESKYWILGPVLGSELNVRIFKHFGIGVNVAENFWFPNKNSMVSSIEPYTSASQWSSKGLGNIRSIGGDLKAYVPHSKDSIGSVFFFIGTGYYSMRINSALIGTNADGSSRSSFGISYSEEKMGIPFGIGFFVKNIYVKPSFNIILTEGKEKYKYFNVTVGYVFRANNPNSI